MQINIQPSFDTFRALRESNAYYVDKTRMLREYLDGRFDRAALLARPRRFGKTLTMTMIRDFLDIRQDSRQIFEGLDIMSDPDTVHRYMNQYPVVFISLKEVFGSDFGEILQNLRIAVSKLCEEYAYLLESPKISDAGRAGLPACHAEEAVDQLASAVPLPPVVRIASACCLAASFDREGSCF